MSYLIFSGCNTPPNNTQIGMDEVLMPAQFTGEASCQSCHTSEHTEWKQSDHFRAMELPNDSTVLGDFSDIIYKADGVTSRFFKKDGKFYIETEGGDGKNHEFEVQYTFGYFPLQQYLVTLPGGRMQASRVSWDSREKKWFNQYPGNHIPHSDWLHWTGNSQNWNTMCASCHSTNLKKNYDVTHDTYNTTWKDLNVACESCHGPGSNHIDFVKSTDFKNGRRLINSGFIYSRDTISQLQLNSCAPCHARKSDISDSLFHSGELLDDMIPQIINNEFYHADGQIKQEAYEFGSFAQSKMFHNNVQCTSCHNPHSGKLKLEGNNLCISCHKPEYDNPSHHFHAINTEASKCVNCHMPQETYMGNDHRRDHSFRIPRPDQSVKYGTPNTCNSCHKNENAQWASNAIEKWYGSQRAYHFSDDLIPGSLLNQKSETHLLKLIADTSQPAIARATAANYLGSLLSEKSADGLINALKDKEALVRYHTVRSLENFPVNVWIQNALPLLSDKVRAVRIAAADLFHKIPRSSIPATAIAAFQAADMENKNFLHYQTDFSTGNVMLADYQLQDNNYLEAIKFYIRGLQKDSLMNYARLNLSAAYSSIGKNADALKVLNDASKIDPNNDRTYYNLGLLHYEMNNISDAMKNFGNAIKLNSGITGVYYNYGLLLQQQQNYSEAEKVLLKGIAISPGAENLNYAMAYFYLMQNQPGKAKTYAVVLKQLNPVNPEYQVIFKNLGL